MVYRTKVGSSIWIFAVLTIALDLGLSFLINSVALAGFLFLTGGLIL
jgi:hypothetical protein